MRIGVGFISKDSFRAWLSHVSRKGGSIVIEGSSSAFTSYVRKRGEPDGRQAGTNDSPTSQSGAAAASNQQPHQVGDTQNNIINLGAISANSTTNYSRGQNIAQANYAKSKLSLELVCLRRVNFKHHSTFYFYKRSTFF